MTRSTNPARQDAFVRAARFVGDFGNPFYDEERQRDVWNEASAFGLQLLLWGVLVASTVTVWTVGGPAVPYVAGVLTLLAMVCGLTVGYAARLGVDVTQPQRMLRLRLLPYLLVVLALAAGFVHSSRHDLSPSFGIGLAVGTALALGAAALAARRASRQTADASL